VRPPSTLADLADAIAIDDDATALLLTTYEHLPWNAPFYERHGFHRLREEELGPELSAALAFERAHLPLPERRIASRWAPVGR
jgi:hypothetical protein